ncbi:MAG: phosphoadenylyl-sulfate reductase [Spirochaetota bacterium]
MQTDNTLIENLIKKLEAASLEEKLIFLAEEFNHSITFSSSLGLEDQAISHAILSQSLQIPIFFLDTGRHFEETYEVLHLTNARYQTKIQAYHPNYEDIETLLNQKGPNSFYNSIEDRKECCHIRKVNPLQRALAGKKCWVTGIRKEQSENRNQMQAVEWDEGNQILKVHPIFDWSEEQLNSYIQKNQIPTNYLHKKGFPSIGCAPCTRAVKEGESARSGRWWWEQDSQLECGLHTK